MSAVDNLMAEQRFSALVERANRPGKPEVITAAREAVRKAKAVLNARESALLMLLVERGRSMAEIGMAAGLSKLALEAVHHSAMTKLARHFLEAAGETRASA